MQQGDGTKIDGSDGAGGNGWSQPSAQAMVQPSAGPSAWPAQVAGSANASAGQNHPAPVPAHRRGMQFRRNVEVPLDKVAEAVLKHVIEEAERDGRELGSHLHRRATIFYLDANGQPVPLDHVVVAVED